MSQIAAAAPQLLLKSEWMVQTNKDCNSHPFTSPLKKDGIPQFPSKFCGMVDGYRPFKDGYPSLSKERKGSNFAIWQPSSRSAPRTIF